MNIINYYSVRSITSDDDPSKQEEKLDLIPSEAAGYQEEEFHQVNLGLTALISPPIEREYRHLESGKTYYNPNHSSLIALAMKCFVNGEYKGFGLTRRKIVVIPKTRIPTPCDFLYLIKRKNQINYETEPTDALETFSKGFTNCLRAINLLPDMHKRIENQKKGYEYFRDEYLKNAKNWNYGQVYYLDCADEFKKFGFPEGDWQRLHGILLFYKEMK